MHCATTRFLGDVTRMNIYDLKIRGHEILDELVRLGYSRNETYRILGRRLGGGQKKAHFSNMRGHNEVERAVLTLEDMLDRRRKKLEGKQKRKADKQIVPIDRALLREVGERNRARYAGDSQVSHYIPWYHQLLTEMLAAFRRW